MATPTPLILNGATELVDVSTLKTHPRNPRRGNLDTIRESIRVNGFYGVLVAQRSTRRILAGNHRFLAARDEGHTSLPVVWVDVGDAEALRILAADNRTSDLGGYDDPLLASLLAGLSETAEGLLGTGYTSEDLSALLGDLGGEDNTTGGEGGPPPDPSSELQSKWGTAGGQVWVAGVHRLMCGDSTDRRDVATLLGTNAVDLLLTDPPYGVSYADKNAFLNAVAPANRIQKRIEADHGSVGDMATLWRASFGLAHDALKPGGCYYITGPQGGDLSMMMMMIQESGLALKHILIWVKNNHVLGRSDYNYQHEPILYGWKPGAAHYFGGNGSDTSVWRFDKPHAAKLHPTMKPVDLWAHAMERGSRRGECVYDPFHGSGTTAVAAQQTGRICYGMEVDPGYVAVQLERLSDMGLEPRLAS